VTAVTTRLGVHPNARCAVTPDNGVYCAAGKHFCVVSRFLMTPTASWLGEQN
jgi:hypothetical protein